MEACDALDIDSNVEIDVDGNGSGSGESDCGTFVNVSNNDTNIATAISADDVMGTQQDIDIEMEEVSMEPEHLLEYHTEAAVEAVNILLPEIPANAAVDCTGFADFDEFNLCLNNILSDDDEDGGLSPGEMIGASRADDSHTKQAPLKATVNSWNKRLTASSEQLDDIFEMVQLQEEVSLHFEDVQTLPLTLEAGKGSRCQQHSGDLSAAATSTSTSSTVAKAKANAGPNVTVNTSSVEIVQPLPHEAAQSLLLQQDELNGASVGAGAGASSNSSSKVGVSGGSAAAMDAINRNSHSIVNIFQ